MNRYGSRNTFDLDWVERWARRVNEDRVLPVFGRFFNARWLLAIDDSEYVIEMRDGKIARIKEGLAANDLGYDFGLRTTASAWGKFCQEIPPPMFNDIVAMAHPLHRNLVIEGNHLPYWQNLRALTHMLALMRQI